jgi:hypothetical protein
MANLKILTGKNRLQELVPSFLWEMGLVQTHGDTKYAPKNWQDAGTTNPDDYYGAIMRHLLRYFSGEKHDSETGLHHMAAIACSAMYMYWHDCGDAIDITRKCICPYCNKEGRSEE